MDSDNNKPKDDSANADSALSDILALEPTDIPKVDAKAVAAATLEEDGVSSKKESKRIRWRCRNCHYQYEGYEKFEACPRCGKDPSFFEDVE